MKRLLKLMKNTLENMLEDVLAGWSATDNHAVSKSIVCFAVRVFIVGGNIFFSFIKGQFLTLLV